MKAIEKKTNTTIHDFRGICKLAFIALAVFALVIIPYKVDLNKGSLKATVLLADDSGGDSHGDSDGGSDSDGGNDSDSDHDSDGDHDSYESDQDSDDGEHDGDEHDSDDGDEHDSDDQKSSHDDSIGSDSSSGSSDELLDVGGMQGLKEIPSEDEASLVGNWGKSSNR